MITHLTIQGLAVIDSLSIEFTPGFNVITGETGAGKSILIRALHFLLGGKVTADAIREGSSQATVTAEFVVPQGHPALQAMDQLGIECDYSDAGGAILIRRQLSQKGRSQSWVNDVLVTSQPLREIGRSLVDVFGQHENQRLMDEHEHITYVDAFLGEPEAKDRVATLSRECDAIVAGLSKSIEAFHSREKSKDYLSFRLDALAKFAPGEADYERVAVLCRDADKLLRLKETLTKAASCLDGDGTDVSPSKAVWEAARLLEAVEGDVGRAGELGERCLGTARELDDLSYEMGKLASSFDIDERELEEAQGRLFGYQELFRKHGMREIGELVNEASRLKEELAFLETAAQHLEEGLSALQGKASELQQSATALTRLRSRAAEIIRKRVGAELTELAMPGAVLEVRFSTLKRSVPSLDFGAVERGLHALWQSATAGIQGIGADGAERCEFLLAANPGTPLLPLTKVASGGEMSRIMLALKKALVADAETCVLVFDEIDTGISGRVADVVGRKMRELSHAFQVICISHLPQVAVYADTHFLVTKAVEGGKRTESSIVRLTRDDSAREIARLLSGAEVSSPSLANAKSLIERARGKRSRESRSRPS